MQNQFFPEQTLECFSLKMMCSLAFDQEWDFDKYKHSTQVFISIHMYVYISAAQ